MLLVYVALSAVVAAVLLFFFAGLAATIWGVLSTLRLDDANDEEER